MRAAITVLREQLKHFYLIRRLSLYELKSNNETNYLGVAWELINPCIQILIYWFVFGSIRQRADVDIATGETIPFILWLLTGFIVWIFFYKGTIQASKSIYSRLRMLSKMNFPLSVIPNIVVFSNFYIHAGMTVVAIVILNLSGFYISVHYIQLLYFTLGLIAFIFSLALITSTLSTIIRDVHMFLNATLRMVLYLSPILWPIAAYMKIPTIITVIKLNPLYYIIEGYRAALFGTEWYMVTHWQYSLYFWGLVVVLFMIGATLHVKFRRHFIDYL